MGKHRERNRQQIRVELHLGTGWGAAAEVGLTPAGLWAVAGLVAGALLGSAAVVAAARRPVGPRRRHDQLYLPPRRSPDARIDGR